MTYKFADSLGAEMHKKGEHEEAKKPYTQVYEGRREVLGREAKVTIALLTNLAIVKDGMGDCQAALDC